MNGLVARLPQWMNALRRGKAKEPEFAVPVGFRTTEISAVVTRADGTVEDLGVICTMKGPVA